MKSAKRIIALLIAVMMVTVCAVSTVSANAVVDKFEVIEFGVFNAAGDAPDEIGANKTVTVKATLKRVDGANNTDIKASVIAAVYSGNELVDVAGSTKTYYNYGTTQENIVKLEIPDGKADLSFKAFLWDGNMITPLAKSSDEAEITGITVGGVEVEGFNAATKSYTVNLPVGSDEEPEVLVEANGITNADVTYENNVATIKMADATYTVSYTPNPYEVTDVKYYYNKSLSNIAGVTPVILDDRIEMKAPSQELLADTSKKLSDVMGSATKENILRHATYGWEDRYWSIFYEVPEEIVGYTYIPGDMYADEGGSSCASGTYAVYELTINGATEIVFPGASNRCTLQCVTDNNEKATASVKSYTGNFSLINFGASEYTGTTIATGIASKKTFSGGSTLYSAVLTVPEGQTSATWRIEARSGGDWFPAFLMYKFTEPELEVFAKLSGTKADGTIVSNVEYQIGAVPFMLPTYTQDTNEFLPDSTTENPTYGKYFLGNAVEWNATLNEGAGAYGGKAGGSVWNVSAIRFDANDYIYPQSCPEELIGSKWFMWNTSASGYGIKSNDTNTVATLTINKDATLYFNSTDEFVAKSGATQMERGIGTLDAGSYYNCTQVYYVDDPTVPGNLNYHGGRLFKLELDVPEGASSATFEIPLVWYEGHHPIMFIK